MWVLKTPQGLDYTGGTPSKEFEVIGIDVGTSVIKGVLVDSAQRVIYDVSSKSAPLSYPAPGFVEVNPEAVFREFSRVVKSILQKARQRQILLSISAMAPVFIPVNRQGNVIRPAILYNDARTTSIIDQLKNEELWEMVFAINGNLINVQMWIPKLLWLKQNEPTNYKETAKIFDLTSFIIYRLTGEHVIDFTVAQETGLLNYSKREWSGELLSALDIDDSLLPRLMKPTEIVSEVSESWKREWGVPEDASIQINPGCVDAIASALSLGFVRENEAAIIAGSTGIIVFSTTQPKPDKRLYLDLSPIDGLYFINGSTAAAGLFFDYILELLGIPEPRYKNAEKLLEECKEGSKSVVMLPYIQGERTPIFDPAAKSVLFGLTSTTTRCDIVRGSLEAVAFSLKHNVQALRENGFISNKIRVSGGMAKSRLFLQILADVLQSELIYYPSASAELADAFIGFVALGSAKNWTEIEKWIKSGEVVKPDPSKFKEYDIKYSVYLDLYEKLKDDFRRV